MQKTLLGLLLWLLTTTAQAQTADSTRSYRHHIGLNTQFAQDQFFNPNARTPLQIMYKRQNKGNSAWRVGVGVMYAVDDSTAYQLSMSGNHYYFNGRFSIGYERQKKIASKWILYYGIDVLLDWRYKKYDGEIPLTWSVGVNETLYGFIEKTELMPALSTFIGIRYQVLPRFYLATEMSLVTQYYYSEIATRATGKRVSTKGNDYYKSYKLNFQPYSGLYCFYNF